MTEPLREAKPSEGAWWGVYYKLPKNFVPGAAAGTIPGFAEQTEAGFFVIARDKEEAKKEAKKMFAEFRKRWGPHAISPAQEKLLELRFKRLPMGYATHEECLHPIMNKAGKVGDKYWCQEFRIMYEILKIFPKGGLEWGDIRKYLPKGYRFIDARGNATCSITIDPNEREYLLIDPRYRE